MKKSRASFDQEFQQLMQELTGETIVFNNSENNVDNSSKEKSTSFQNIRYQLPLRHNASGEAVNEEGGIGPTVVSTYMPGLVNHSHPQGHHGVDLQAPKGAPVYPIGPGEVIRVNTGTPKGGNTVVIAHEDGRVTSYYAHLDRITVSSSQEVDINTIIGTVGNSGNARRTAPHLHYEVTVDGKKIDPQKIVGANIGSISKQASLVRNILKDLNKFAIK